MRTSKIYLSKKVVEMRNITKKFGELTVNDNISLTLRKGEVHALLGENGAGKSTLMNILYGLYQATSGEIYINGKPANITNPNVAIDLGIGMVHQHFMLVHPFTVTENIVLGLEPTKFINLDLKSAREKVVLLSKQYNLAIDPDAKISDISVGMQQRVEILKALYRGVDVLILDEPTAALTPQEITDLIEIIDKLAADGKTIILITHKLKEIKQTSDFCTVIRRGKCVATVDVTKTSEDELAELMLGRQFGQKLIKSEVNYNCKPIFEIKSLKADDYRHMEILKGIDLDVYPGEILGIAGVDGNGQKELAETITGLRRANSGSVMINGKEIVNLTPREIFESGLANIPEDRHKHGLVLDFDVAENMILQNYRTERFVKGIELQKNLIYNFADDLIKKFDIRPNNSHCTVRTMSGGNQQKVIIAREITNNPDVLLAVNPTRGLDVGAIEFVHKYIVEQRNANKAVILISFELDEILSLSDRIAVIFEGKISGIVYPHTTSERELGLMMAGGNLHEEV